MHKLKVYQLPIGTPQSRGKAFVNILPLEKGETISVVMPLPEDEEQWSDLDVVFATSQGTIRRNSLSAFKNIRANGLIAMKLDEEHGERLIDVRTCTEDHDVMLATRLGKAIRFPVTDVRVFQSRNSTGVRGIKLANGDEVMSISILYSTDATVEERNAYLKAASQMRGADDVDIEGDIGGDLSPERFAEMAERENFILSVTSKGFGKRTSSYEYRTAGRGGQGIWTMKLNKRNGEIVRSFCVDEGDEIMMVSNGGQIIRMPIHDIRFAGRQTQGVTLFRVADGEDVVSVAAIRDNDDEDEDTENVEASAETAENTEEAAETNAEDSGSSEPTEE